MNKNDEMDINEIRIIVKGICKILEEQHNRIVKLEKEDKK